MCLILLFHYTLVVGKSVSKVCYKSHSVLCSLVYVVDYLRNDLHCVGWGVRCNTLTIGCLVNDVSYWLRRWDFLKWQNAAAHGLFWTHYICWWCVDVVSMLTSWHIWSVRTSGRNRTLLLRIACSSWQVSSHGRHGPLMPLRYTCTLPCAAICVDGLRVLLLVCRSRYYVALCYHFWSVLGGRN